MKNTGIHHISVLSSNAEKAYFFYHTILGLALRLKTVNQEDHHMYHLFFGDDYSETEFTIFEMGEPYKKRKFGTNSIERTLFLVKDIDSLYYWKKRLAQFGVKHEEVETYNGRYQLKFEDFDGQPLGFTTREANYLSEEKQKTVDQPYAILGICEVHLRVKNVASIHNWLTTVFGFCFKETILYSNHNVHIFQFDGQNHYHEIHVIEDTVSPIQHLCVGGVHHLALGVVNNDDLECVIDALTIREKQYYGIKDRGFFESLYFRDENYILIEVATSVEQQLSIERTGNELFENIALDLPFYLEEQRQIIEQKVGSK